MRTLTSILLGKAIYGLTRFSKTGGGSAAPGLYSLKIQPKLTSSLASQIPQNIIITGTNGKTTTSRMLSQFLESGGFRVLHNSTGSNLERGIASTLLSAVDFQGKIEGIDIGLWETDEAAFNKLVFQLKPQFIVFLNVFRDQLDRYGEVDSVVSKWQQALKKIDWNPTILVNGNDGHTLSLAKNKNTQPIIFRVDDIRLKWEKEANLDPKTKVISAKITKNNGLKGNRVEVSLNQKKASFDIPVPGKYHVFDFLASFALANLIGIKYIQIKESLTKFSPAFGRVEKLKLGKKEGYIFLIKNPAGASSVFETIQPELKKADRILIALNDNFADGTDVSWIWDGEFEQLITKEGVQVICSGKRAHDLAVRLKYAGINQDSLIVVNDFEQAFLQAKQGLRGRLFILPTYTALLELQKILSQAGIKKEYWEED